MTDQQPTLYKLTFHVPADFLDTTKQAVFAAGAGDVAGYDQCCWQVLGEGQFRPKPGSTPFIGNPTQLERVAEYHVEVMCSVKVVEAAVEALKQAHPYEQPSYAVFKLEPF